MDFESSFIHCIKTNDTKGLHSLKINGSIANRVFVGKHQVNQPESLNGVQVPRYSTPLVFAILCKQEEIVFELIKLGAKLDVSVNGWKPIHFAIATNQIKLTKKLFDYDKEQISYKTDKNASTLHFAISISSVELVEYLLINKANANEATSNGNTPLHSAVTSNNEQILKDLIAFGGKQDAQNKQGKTPIQIAQERNSVFAINVFKQTPISVNDVKTNYELILKENEEKDSIDPASDLGEINTRIKNLSSRMSVVEEKLGLQ